MYSNGNCYTKVASTTEKIYEIYNVTTNYEKDTSTKTLVSDWVLGTTNSATGNYDYHEQEQGDGKRTKTTVGTNGWINSTSTTKYVQNGTASTLEEDTGDVVYQWSNKSTAYKNKYTQYTLYTVSSTYSGTTNGEVYYQYSTPSNLNIGSGTTITYDSSYNYYVNVGTNSSGQTIIQKENIEYSQSEKSVTYYVTKKTLSALYRYPVYLCTKKALYAWTKI